MKILLISPKMEKPNGGIAVWTDEYLSCCEKSGIDCSLVNTAPVGIRAEDGSANRNYLDEFKRTKRIFSGLKKALNEDFYDAVHLNSSCGTLGVIRDFLIAKRIKEKYPCLKLLTQFHCDIPYQIGNFISRLFLKKLVAISDECLVLCQNSQDYLQRFCKAESVLIPNFIAESLVIPDEKEIAAQLSTLFYVGRVEKAKGMLELFEVASSFPEISFELAGAVSEELRMVQKPDNVILLGPIAHEKVLEYMDRADAFIFPSHSEGFSVALLESMARGLPCIATDVGANRDMLESSGGIVISVEDLSALKDGIKILQNPQQRQKMSRWCTEKVRTYYTVNRVLEQLIKIYSA